MAASACTSAYRMPPPPHTFGSCSAPESPGKDMVAEMQSYPPTPRLMQTVQGKLFAEIICGNPSQLYVFYLNKIEDQAKE